MSLTVTVAVVRAAAPHIVCYLPAYRGMVPLLHLPEDVLETYRHLDFPNRVEVRALLLAAALRQVAHRPAVWKFTEIEILVHHTISCFSVLI